jgi:hypothetical protein
MCGFFSLIKKTQQHSGSQHMPVLPAGVDFNPPPAIVTEKQRKAKGLVERLKW